MDVNTLVNGRTFAFDLDSVYGGGPTKSPQLYYGDKFLLGTATDGVSPDLPRNPDGIDDNDDDGTAILVEHRNDENLIIAQIHLSFLRLHNALVDQGMSFGEAHDTVVNAYRYVVLHDYLPQIVGQDAVDAALNQACPRGVLRSGERYPLHPGRVLGGGIPVRSLSGPQRVQHQRHVGRRASVLARMVRSICAAAVSSPPSKTRTTA